MKVKIGLIAPFLTHYRVNFYKKLQSSLGGDIVYFSQQKEKNDGRPGITFEENSVFQSYSNVSISLGSVKPLLSIDLIRKIRRNNIRLIVIEGATSNLTSWYFILFRKMLGIRIIAWACGWQPENHIGFVRKVKKLFERVFFNNIDWILAYSTTTEKYFRRIGIKTGITVAYNGIDTDQYVINRQAVINSAISIRGGEKRTVFLYVGGIFKDKKVDFLLDSFLEFNKKFRESVLWIIGDGPDKKELELKVKNNGPSNIVFWGRKESDVDQYFAAADIFILPGVGGLALNQAMMWGIPCIVSDADGTENDLVIEEETGFRFIKNDNDSLVSAMSRAALLQGEKREKMSNKARNLILERSNTDKMAVTFCKVIRNLTSDR